MPGVRRRRRRRRRRRSNVTSQGLEQIYLNRDNIVRHMFT
jgi:hypothetical protein